MEEHLRAKDAKKVARRKKEEARSYKSILRLKFASKAAVNDEESSPRSIIKSRGS